MKLRTSTKSSSLPPRKTELDSNKNLLPPRTTLLGTNSDKTKSTEKSKPYRTTNATAISSSLDPSSTIKKLWKSSIS